MHTGLALVVLVNGQTVPVFKDTANAHESSVLRG